MRPLTNYLSEIGGVLWGLATSRRPREGEGGAIKAEYAGCYFGVHVRVSLFHLWIGGLVVHPLGWG